MYRYDPEFREYATSAIGIKKFRVVFNRSCYVSRVSYVGKTEWRLLNKLHRENDENNVEQPTIIYDNGLLQYYKSGKLHRDDDNPAVIYPGQRVEYYKNGNRHRDNINGESQPACVYPTHGMEIYYYNGALHREDDKPAWNDRDHKIEYYKNDKLHRDDDSDGNPQPAVIYADGSHRYYKNGISFKI